MSEILFRYERVNPTTWAYLSSLLTLALYFKFNRIWSMRNFDLISLISLAPCMLLIKFGMDPTVATEGLSETQGLIETIGYTWLFVVGGVFLIRLLSDSAMVRRPLLEPNMNISGMSFLGISLYLFLMANVMVGPASRSVTRLTTDTKEASVETFTGGDSSFDRDGPGFFLLYQLPQIKTSQLPEGSEGVALTEGVEGAAHIGFGIILTSRMLVVCSHLTIILGMVLIGGRHFENLQLGVCAAVLYLIMPYTALWTGEVTHVLPGAFLVMAILFYRQPLVAGGFIGLAFSAIYYPLFLLPLWISYYWRKGAFRFLLGFMTITLCLLLLHYLRSSGLESTGASFGDLIRQSFGLRLPTDAHLQGVWRHWNEIYRKPLLAAFLGMSACLAIWPAQKNLGTLLSCTAAVMIGTQFWHAHGGAISLAWYLPLFLLVIFRPNLEDRVAINLVKDNRWLRRKPKEA